MTEEAFFEVEEREVDFPIMVGKRKRYKVIDRYKAIVKVDGDVPLSIVSKNYKLVTHASVVGMAERALKEYTHRREVRVAQGGAQMFARFALDGDGVEVGKDDIVNPILEVANCYDMTFRLGFELCAERQVCSNGMRLPVPLARMARKHIGNAIEDFMTNLTKSLEQWEPALKVWQNWSQKEIVANTGYEIVEKLESLPRKYRKAITDRWMQDGEHRTVYDLYNHMTYVTTHELGTTVDRQRELEMVTGREFERALRKQGVVA